MTNPGSTSPDEVATSLPFGEPVLSSIKLVDFHEFQDLKPGEFRTLPGTKDKCIFRKKGKPGADPKSVDPADFIATTCARARSFQKLMQLNALVKEVAQHRPAAPLASSNPSSETPMAQNFDPLAELIKEFGPSAHLGEELPSSAPEYDSTYPASMDRGPFGLSTAAYGARRSLPVNRRNPADSALLNARRGRGKSVEAAEGAEAPAPRAPRRGRGKGKGAEAPAPEPQMELLQATAAEQQVEDESSQTQQATRSIMSDDYRGYQARERKYKPSKPVTGSPAQQRAREEFRSVARMLESVQAGRKDETGKDCSLQTAWYLLGRKLSAGEPLPARPAKSNPATAKRPSSEKQIAARQRFAALAKAAQYFQESRGCSPKEAWKLARDQYRAQLAQPNPAASAFGDMVRKVIAYQKSVQDREGRNCSWQEAWKIAYPENERVAKTGGMSIGVWRQKFAGLVKAVHATQASRGCSLKEAWAHVSTQANVAKPNPDDDFEQTPDTNVGGSYLDYVDQDMYGYEAPASPPNEPWDWASQYEYRQGAYGPAAQFPPTNRRNPMRRNPDEDYTKWSAMDLVELSNRGDEDASDELARREARREAKVNGRSLFGR